MVFVKTCVGSSCHIRGSGDIVELLKRRIEEHHLENEVIPILDFCFGKCNRYGVTVQVDEDVYTGITRESFDKFFEENILPRANTEG